MNRPIDLTNPEEIALLRHSLVTALNQVIGNARIVREQARDQASSASVALMDRVLEPARQLVEIVRRLLPPKSHVSEPDVARLRANTSARADRIQAALAAFDATGTGACAAEIGKMRLAMSELTDFATGMPQIRPAPGARPNVFEMPPAEGMDELSGKDPHQVRGRDPHQVRSGSGPYYMPPASPPAQMEAGSTVFEMPPATADTEPPQQGWATARILVADDDPANRELLSRRLQQEGFTPATEAGGEAALARLEREEFDLLLLDLDMPVVDGFAVLHQLGSNPRLNRLPVIVLSPGEQESAIRALEMGAADFLVRPFDPVILRARVGAVLRRREAEAGRAGMAERLREASKLETAGRLAGRVAHDFNNLLTGILGNASLLAEGLPPADPNHQLVADILTASERAADLTRQLLAITGKGTSTVAPVDVSRSIGEVGDLLERSLPKPVRLNLRLAEGLPVIHADIRQIRELIINLVSNAGEAIGEQPGSVTVETGVRHLPEGGPAEPPFGPPAPGDYAYVSVEDTGSGMDPDTRLRIFEPFFSTRPGRRGLGLATAVAIARAHHGLIHVRTKPGRGSHFELLMPMMVPESRPVEQPPKQVPAAESTILVVDDDELVRRTTRAMLEARGYHVLLADSGRQAVDLFREQAGSVSLILLDLTMPAMPGDEAARYLRAIRPDVPILISSGPQEGELARRLVGRAAGFVSKPYSAATLLETVDAILG